MSRPTRREDREEESSEPDRRRPLERLVQEKGHPQAALAGKRLKGRVWEAKSFRARCTNSSAPRPW